MREVPGHEHVDPTHGRQSDVKRVSPGAWPDDTPLEVRVGEFEGFVAIGKDDDMGIRDFEEPPTDSFRRALEISQGVSGKRQSMAAAHEAVPERLFGLIRLATSPRVFDRPLTDAIQRAEDQPPGVAPSDSRRSRWEG